MRKRRFQKSHDLWPFQSFWFSKSWKERFFVYSPVQLFSWVGFGQHWWWKVRSVITAFECGQRFAGFEAREDLLRQRLRDWLQDFVLLCINLIFCILFDLKGLQALFKVRLVFWCLHLLACRVLVADLRIFDLLIFQRTRLRITSTRLVILQLLHLSILGVSLRLLILNNRLLHVPLAERFQLLFVLDLFQGRFAVRIDRKHVWYPLKASFWRLWPGSNRVSLALLTRRLFFSFLCFFLLFRHFEYPANFGLEFF